MKQLNIDWKAAIGAGLLAGMVFLILEMMLVPLVGGGSPWGPPRMMAAILLGKGVLPPPASFALGIVMVALALHLVLSVGYAVIFALAISRLHRGAALALGAAGGLVLYLVNFYGFTTIFPWFAMAGPRSPSSPMSSSDWSRPGAIWPWWNAITTKRRQGERTFNSTGPETAWP